MMAPLDGATEPHRPLALEGVGSIIAALNLYGPELLALDAATESDAAKKDPNLRRQIEAEHDGLETASDEAQTRLMGCMPSSIEEALAILIVAQGWVMAEDYQMRQLAAAAIGRATSYLMDRHGYEPALARPGFSRRYRDQLKRSGTGTRVHARDA